MNNYRSHPALIDLSSGLFYDGSLIAAADKARRNLLADWDGLPKRGFPLFIHGINGKDEREGNSPSWFNADEVKAVNKIISALLDTRKYGLRASDIGVISPYRKQVQKIQASLNNSGIKVGSVEEFQGQEREVIIISTVRSSPGNIHHDLAFNLGFLRNPKRFNVAVTRAKALMIVVGNPLVLQEDMYWGELVDYCRDNGAIKNWDPKKSKKDEGVVGALISSLDRMRMADQGVEALVDLNSHAVGAVSSVEDPEWNTQR
jgi:helicase MOV-10